MYFQIAVGQEPTQAGFSILTMFYSFFVAARIGGGWMDKFGAEETGLDRLPPRHDRDDRLGRRAERTQPLRKRWSGCCSPAPASGSSSRRSTPTRSTGCPTRCAARARGHPDLPQLRLGDRHGDHGQHRRRRHRPDRRLRPADFADAMQTAFYVGAGMLAVGYVAARTAHARAASRRASSRTGCGRSSRPRLSKSTATALFSPAVTLTGIAEATAPHARPRRRRHGGAC